MISRVIGYARMKIERRSRWDSLWSPVDWVCQRIEEIYWSYRGYLIVECLGDSHVAAFRRINFTYPEVKYRFRTKSVLGATAYGLGKERSSTNVRSMFEKQLARLKGGGCVLLCLGEVDASFLIWFLAEKKNTSIEVMFAESINRYREFLLLAKPRVKNLIVCSAPLPTIKDGQKHPKELLLRDTIDVPYIDRTHMVLRFNDALRKFCESNEILFLDLDEPVIDRRTGLLDERYIRQDRYDNHYIEQEYVKVIVPQFEELAAMIAKRNKNNGI